MQTRPPNLAPGYVVYHTPGAKSHCFVRSVSDPKNVITGGVIYTVIHGRPRSRKCSHQRSRTAQHQAATKRRQLGAAAATKRRQLGAAAAASSGETTPNNETGHAGRVKTSRSTSRIYYFYFTPSPSRGHTAVYYERATARDCQNKHQANLHQIAHTSDSLRRT